MNALDQRAPLYVRAAAVNIAATTQTARPGRITKADSFGAGVVFFLMIAALAVALVEWVLG